MFENWHQSRKMSRSNLLKRTERIYEEAAITDTTDEVNSGVIGVSLLSGIHRVEYYVLVTTILNMWNEIDLFYLCGPKLAYIGAFDCLLFMYN
jgi:hypothetical protein